jgi:multiple sugar transport system ATP-binding protein
MEHLVVERLVKMFSAGGRIERAVEAIDLTAFKGEFVSLLGPSGCGKTTTLRCIAGLETPTSGAIFIGGVEKTHSTPQQRNVGMCFQEATVYPHMTLRDNLAYPLKLQRVDQRERQRRVGEMASVLKIESLLDKFPGQLSGGQRQRGALGRALIRRPDLFLLDEPMSSLDAKLRVEMRKELKTITNLFGTTVLYVTHDQEEAMALSDRICVMNQGRIEQFDTPEGIYREPGTTFVATFIGVPAMNLFDCSAARQEDGKLAAINASGAVISDLKQGVASEGDSILLGVRPEDIQLSSAESEGGFQGVVRLVEVLGERTILHIDSSIGEVRAIAYGISPHRGGHHLRFRFKPSSMHVFGLNGRRVGTPSCRVAA